MPQPRKISCHNPAPVTDDASRRRCGWAWRWTTREEGKRQVLRVVATWKEKFPRHARERLAVIFREMGVEVR